MCSLVTWISVFPDIELLVAANRDERYSRPSSGPLHWPGTPRIVAPRDDLAGGTWWAWNEHRLFVGVTNRAGNAPDASRRSRGQLVIDVARLQTLDAAEALLRGIAVRAYNEFHLLVTDGRAAVRLIATDDAMRIDRLGKGMHVLTERSFGAAPPDREAPVREAFESLQDQARDLGRLQQTLATHDQICVHHEAFDYGTRSSTVLVLGAQPTLLFADGPPCRTPFVDRSELLFAQ